MATAVPAIAVVALALGLLGSDVAAPPGENMTLETWSAPPSGLVADLGTADDPLAALEAFQSPTAGLLDLNSERTP